MGAALENARLFDETQRLLKETEQRNVRAGGDQQHPAGHGGGAELPGHRRPGRRQAARGVRAPATSCITWRDEAAGPAPHPLHLRARRAAATRRRCPTRRQRRSTRRCCARKPVIVGDRGSCRTAWACITSKAPTRACRRSSCRCSPASASSARSCSRTTSASDAFGEADVRLLSTIAASMGVALENARLLEETQRRERESTALSEVGRDLSSTLDLATVMDRIAGHAKELLAAQNSAIFLPDAATGHYRAIVALGELADALKATTIEPGQGIIGSLLQSGQAELINSSAADPRALQIPGTETRSDERLMVVPLLAGDDGAGRDGGVAQRRQPVRGARARVPGRPVAPGDDRAAERAAVRRDPGSAGAANRHRRCAAGHQRLDGRRAARVRPHPGQRRGAVRRPGLGVYLVGDDGMVHKAAIRGQFKERIEAQFPIPLEGSATGAAIAHGHVVSFADVLHGAGVPAGLRKLAQGLGMNYALAQAPMMWQGRGLGAINVARFDMRAFTEKEMQPAGNLCQPGRDRDPERAAVQGGAGSPRRRRDRQRGQERLPGDHEPRDPHADERGHRHERPAARHAAQRRAARLCQHHPRQRRRAADDHQRHPRLLEDRGRAHGHRGAALRPARVRGVGAGPDRRRARPRSTWTSPTCSRGEVPAGHRRRRDAAAPDPAQPAQQRGQVHRDGRGRADACADAAAASDAALHGARHRHRPVAKPA